MDIGDEMPSHPSFPNLKPGNHRITSDRTIDYNCIAWAAGDDRRWWWPGAIPDTYWPDGVARIEELACFIEAFSTLGYAPCEDSGLDEGLEKVVIYAKDDKPTHAARQLPDGSWSSKLGRSFDISHTLDALDGPDYGGIVLCLARPVGADR